MPPATAHEFIVRTKNVVKEYTMGGQTLRALKGLGVWLALGPCFVCVPSHPGCP